MSTIFLSHSSCDNTIAEQVKTHLEQWGHRSIFLDFDPADGIPAGRDWEKELYAKLRECRAVIILCSHTSLASRWCFAEITHARALGKHMFPIKIDDAQIDCVLTGVQIIDASTGWDTAYQRLEKGLLDAGLDPKDLFHWDATRPPYPGLMAFQEQEAAIFFGREKEIREGQALLNRLQQFGGPRLTLMLGASGSGKSSLMRAGLLPRLKRNPRWVVVEPFRPLNAPYDELARVLEKPFRQVMEGEGESPKEVVPVPDPIQLGERVKSVEGFLELIKELHKAAGVRDATVLLMIDQCEELLTDGANKEGDRFLAFLCAVLDRTDSPLMVLATLRSDFLGSFQEHSAMRGVNVETFPVPQMETDGLASVIEGPARVAGLELGPGLVQAMVHDTQTSDALPLLAFTLRELYERFGRDKVLTLEQYRDKLGGLEGSVASAAEAVLRANSSNTRAITSLRMALLSMVRMNDKDQYAKQPVQWKDLPPTVHDLLEHFVRARLLLSSGDENNKTLEVAHEALFRAWPRVAEWLKDNKEFLIWRQRLRGTIKHYEEEQGNPDLFLRGFPLTEALEWMKKKPESFSDKEGDFVRSSHQRRKLRRLGAATFAGFVLAIIVVMTFLWVKRYNLDQGLLKAKSLVMEIHLEPSLEDMISLPGGTFRQGDVEELGVPSWTNPIRTVTIQPFAMGKYEVTFEEYDRFAIATGRDLPDDQGWGRGRRPVINISWEDAKAYATWLTEKTEEDYRLPTESEWEYAARSGAEQEEWAGTSDESHLGEFAVYIENSENRTAEVGSKQPSSFGMYDLSGNVWEWVEDCAHDTYKKAPINGSAWLETEGGDCRFRVRRGGSWGTKSNDLRASLRVWHTPDLRFNGLGFRLVKSTH